MQWGVFTDPAVTPVRPPGRDPAAFGVRRHGDQGPRNVKQPVHPAEQRATAWVFRAVAAGAELQQTVGAAEQRGCHHRGGDAPLTAPRDVDTSLADKPSGHLFVAHRVLGAVHTGGDPHCPPANTVGWVQPLVDMLHGLLLSSRSAGPGSVPEYTGWLPRSPRRRRVPAVCQPGADRVRVVRLVLR